MSVPLAQPGQEILAGPERQGSERVWRVRLPDGRRAILGQLLPELAREESVRRRYVRDSERLAALQATCVPATVAIGPKPDPRDPQADPPWRLRVDPPGETVEEWLERCAPARIDEAQAVAARICDALAKVHRQGAILRDLQPKQIVLGEDGCLWLAHIGLARVDLLSTRTASSLILEGSPYASPEHLRGTRIDARSDLYSVGVLLWRALTGGLPFGDRPSILGRAPLPALEIPEALQALLARLLAERSEERPDSAAETSALLRGARFPGKALQRFACQGCGAEGPAGLRICLSCGKTAVQLVHAEDGSDEALAVDLLKLKDEAKVLGPLRETLAAVARDPLPRLDFLIGDVRYYSKEEKAGLVKLPARLFADLEAETAKRLAHRLKEVGVTVELRNPAKDRRRRKRGAVTMATSPLWIGATLVLGNPLFLLGGLVQLLVGYVVNRAPRNPSMPPILRLREGPAALPAADPLVLRLARLLETNLSADVREQVGAIATCVQNAVARPVEGGAVPMLPLDSIVALTETQVAALGTLDQELGSLDEGAIVRALAASEARREPRTARAALLEGLDRLRSLEDLRAAHMQRLLETSSLLRRAAALGANRVENEEDLLAESRALLEADLAADSAQGR